MSSYTKHSIRGGKKLVTTQESTILESPVKFKSNTKDKSNIPMNQLNSVVIKVSEDSSHGNIVTPSPLYFPSVNKNVVISGPKKYVARKLNLSFIDEGCGLGKPNLHVAQDPGVQFSYGVEMERVRWLLGMCNLNQVLDEALNQKSKEKIRTKDVIGHKCVIEHGDITDAEYLDPFTHVYMFDIGFPP